MLCAAVGIYCVISYTVGLRTREVGIRMALGAERPAVVKLILRDVLALLAWGLAAGFLAALALTRFLSHLLFDVRPTDLTTSASVALLVLRWRSWRATYPRAGRPKFIPQKPCDPNKWVLRSRPIPVRSIPSRCGFETAILPGNATIV